jgi:WD40 repeat protein
LTEALLVTNIKQEAPRLDIRCLSAFSGISVRPEDDLVVLDDARVAGSCEWFTSKKDFIDWRGAWSSSPPILWLKGNAAAGKSVLCSHVIGNLAANKLRCSYFFFKHNSTGKSSVRDCLRSLAYQMALDDDSAISRLLDLEKDGESWEHDTDQALWSKLFLRCLFQTDSLGHHYWIIDALDECDNFQSFFQLISKMPKNLRILISSRKTQDIGLCFTGLGDLVAHQHISASDTIGDIRLFIASRMDRLPIDDGESRANLEDRIITKSAGCFLWVRLVIQELERAFSKEAREDVLNKVPQGMNQIYARILTNMAKLGPGTEIAKAILTWSICASRPLSLCEVQHALTLDIRQTVSNLEKSIPLICGQLVFVDHNSRVQVIHQTARDFLLQQKLDPKFAINRQESHTRIAFTCLKFLSGDWFKGQRRQRQKAATRLIPGLSDLTNPENSVQEAAFADYACHFFSDHLYRSSSANPDSLECLWSFLNRNVLSWIEYIARTGDLSSLTRTAKNMRAFLERRAQHFPPISRQVDGVEAWITDLIRVSAKFRTQLLASPSSIHSLIPPMCPSDSIIARTYSTPQRGILVKGLTKQTWDDCLTRIDFHDAQTSAIANGERLFAVGLSNGKVRLYHSMSLQEQNVVNHGERVKVLQFSSEDRFLASSGLRSIRLWDPRSGNQMWTFDTSHQTMALVFKANDELIDVASRTNCILTIGVQDGVEVNRTDLVEKSHDDFLERQPCQSPSLAVFSSDCNLLAVSYRGRPIRLFDVENERFTLSFSREVAQFSGGLATHYSVDAIAFNPSSEINVLLASYGDGELTVYDLWSAEPKHRLSGVFAHSLICSPDGRSLITGSSQGTIQIFDFGGARGDKLNMIYQIDVYEDGIKALSFGQDSLRFIDIRASQCRVWEPAVLVRKDLDEGSHSELSQPLPPLPKRSGILENSRAPEITAIFCNADGKTVFCGRQDGSVLSYRTLDGEKTGILYSHAVTVVALALALASAQDHRLISVDESGRLLIAKVLMEKEKWSTCEILADARLNESATTILVSPAADRFLVVGEKTDALWTAQGESIGARLSSESKTVICHPLHPELFIMLGHQVARLFRWADFEEVTSLEGILLDRLNDSTFGSGTVLVSVRGSSLLSEMRKVMGEPKSNRLVCWQTSNFEAGSISATSLAGFEELGSRIDHVIDVIGTLLFFLDTDLWVCSLDLRTFRAVPQVKRHFFILSEWRGGTGRVLMHFTSMRDLIFAKEGELVVIKRGLEFSETMELSKWNKAFALRVGDFDKGNR